MWTVMLLIGALTLEVQPGWTPIGDEYRASCPNLTAYYLQDYDTDGDAVPDLRLMGGLTVAGAKMPAVAGLVMENGMTGMVIIRTQAEVEIEMTPLEFRGRYPSPCALLGGRGPS